MAFQPRGFQPHPGARIYPAVPSSEPRTSVLAEASDLSVAEVVDRLAAVVRAHLDSPSAPSEASPGLAAEGIASKIDHTLLKADATSEEIARICDEARRHGFATVCVNSSRVARVAELLRGSSTLPIAVVGFPLGAASAASKAFETREAVRDGAREIDMVINLGALKGREYAFVLEDIRQVVEAARPYPVKVILETSALDQEQKIVACALSKAAGAAFVKTSTGFGTGGATADDVALMRQVVGPEMGVKASGGIRTFDDAARMIAAGANRIGASASVAIVAQAARVAGTANPDAAGMPVSPPPGGEASTKTGLY